MNRLETNRRLVEILNRLVENNPDLRFGQILRNSSFVRETRAVNPQSPASNHIDWRNEFYMESLELLERVERCLTEGNT